MNWTDLTWTDLQQVDPITWRVTTRLLVALVSVTTWRLNFAAAKVGLLVLGEFWTNIF